MPDPAESRDARPRDGSSLRGGSLPSTSRDTLSAFRSGLIDRVRAAGSGSVPATAGSGLRLEVPGGEILLPEVFGFCRGVDRALAMLERASVARDRGDSRLVLLGEIIHNPWVNEYFRNRGVRILTGEQRERLEEHVRPSDCAVVPAFGVPLQIEQRLRRIGCEVVDTSCPDVRRVWVWAERAVRDGFSVMIFGRAGHDETVVTKSRLGVAPREEGREGPLAPVGGRYVVVGDLDQAERFCELIRHLGRDGDVDRRFRELFGPEQTNAESAAPFARLAQVSQTTMLYEETMKLRERIAAAFIDRWGPDGLENRLRFQPTVCQATQERQSAAVALCGEQADLAVVVGGFGSSNTRHLCELASLTGPAYLIESAADIRSDRALRCFDLQAEREIVARDWLPGRRPLRITVLAGASSPEIVIGDVLRRLTELLETSEG